MTHFPINTPLGVGDLLDRVFRLYRIHASKLILGGAVFAVPLGILSVLVMGNSTANSFRLLQQWIETGQPVAQQSANSQWASLFTLLAITVQGFMALVTTKLASDALHNQTLSVPTAIRSALRKFFPWLGMMILLVLAMLAIAVAVAIVSFILIFVFSIFFAVIGGGLVGGGFLPPNFEPGIALIIGLVVIGFVLYLGAITLFLSPFAYFYARWSVCLPALLGEDQGPTTAMRRSWNLTQKNVRRSIGYALMTYLSIYAVIGVPMILIELLVTFALPAENLWLSVALFSAISMISNVLISPIGSIASVLFYYELRVRKESYDLQVQLSSSQ